MPPTLFYLLKENIKDSSEKKLDLDIEKPE